jgi:hypothetical protein
MNDTADDHDIGKFDFDYLILVVNVRNGKDWALKISLLQFENFGMVLLVTVPACLWRQAYAVE